MPYLYTIRDLERILGTTGLTYHIDRGHCPGPNVPLGKRMVYDEATAQKVKEFWEKWQARNKLFVKG